MSEYLGTPNQGQELSYQRKSWLTPLSSLQIRDFRWLWFGYFLFFHGMQSQMVAGGWLVYTMTSSPFALGLVSAGWGVPMLMLSLFGGAIADRRQKRNLLLVMQVGIFLTSLIITGLIQTDLIALWHLVVSSMIFGTFFAFIMPARQAFIVELVGKEEITNALALSSVAMNICRIGSPALAGLLLKFIGIPGVYWMVTASYLIVVLTTVMIPPGGTMILRPNVPLMEDVLEGLRYVGGNATILILLIVAFVPIVVAMPYQMLMPVFVKTTFKAGETSLGLLMSAVGIGALSGSSLIAALGNFHRKGMLMLLSGMVFGVALVFFGLTNSLTPAFIYLLFVGGGNSMYITLTNTLLMSNTPQELIGRVMSLFMMTFGLMPLGVLPASALAEVFGAPPTVIVGGALLFLFLLIVTIMKPRIRGL
jgi:MFS family permease